MNDQSHRPGRPAVNGRASHLGDAEIVTPFRRRCPACGASGVRYLRSTGRWLRDDAGAVSFAYVTFCAVCGHEYPADADR